MLSVALCSFVRRRWRTLYSSRAMHKKSSVHERLPQCRVCHNRRLLHQSGSGISSCHQGTLLHTSVACFAEHQVRDSSRSLALELRWSSVIATHATAGRYCCTFCTAGARDENITHNRQSTGAPATRYITTTGNGRRTPASCYIRLVQQTTDNTSAWCMVCRVLSCCRPALSCTQRFTSTKHIMAKKQQTTHSRQNNKESGDRRANLPMIAETKQHQHRLRNVRSSYGLSLHSRHRVIPQSYRHTVCIEFCLYRVST